MHPPQIPGRSFRPGPRRSRRGEARSPSRLLREGPRHVFAGDQGPCRPRRHVDGGDLRGGGDAERQNGGQPAARKLRRAARADLLHAVPWRSHDPPRSHRDRAQRGQAPGSPPPPRPAPPLGPPPPPPDPTESEPNEAKPGDPRHPPAPAAMLGTMQRLLIEDALSAASRDRLLGWLLANKPGARRLRAGLPADWRGGGETPGR